MEREREPVLVIDEHAVGTRNDELTFPLHAEAARRYFAHAGIRGSGFVAR